MFWMALYIFPIHWAVALVLCILKPTSLIQCVAALVLLSANTIGYLKCEKVCLFSAISSRSEILMHSTHPSPFPFRLFFRTPKRRCNNGKIP